MTEVLGNNYMDLRHWRRGRDMARDTHAFSLVQHYKSSITVRKKKLKQGNFILNDYSCYHMKNFKKNKLEG